VRIIIGQRTPKCNPVYRVEALWGGHKRKNTTRMGITTPQIANQDTHRSETVSERILRRFCRRPDLPDNAGGTDNATIENALDFLVRTVPNFRELVEGNSVLDFGCGCGLQAAALARAWGADVVGVDLPRRTLLAEWDRLKSEYQLPNLTLTANLPSDRMFDVVYSCSSFEHFDDPARVLEMMCDRVKPAGKLVITFAEPWYSNNGAHMDGFCRLPWVNLLFSERTIMNVRSIYRSDGARRFEEVEGGLNRLTVAKFERIIRNSSLHIEWLKMWPTRGLPLVTHVPVIRELLTSACSCVLSKKPHAV
jgi:SAM-dependent methyltransferase